MITIDGTFGEGGGQILRTALGLSLVTGTPFRMHSIRAKRAKPGLMRQHLTAVLAAAEVGAADVRGAELGSSAIEFVPRGVRGGSFTFSVGTAGSTTLVLQAILPALLRAPEGSSLVLTGGTHNPLAPPFEFLARTFLPVLRRMGAHVEAKLWRPGFHPAGGGELRVTIEPGVLAPIELVDAGPVRALRATALLANLERELGSRAMDALRRALHLEPDSTRVELLRGSAGPGMVIEVEVERDAVNEVFTGFGEARRSVESIAQALADEVHRATRVRAPVGEYLADQLLVPLALAGAGAFRTGTPSEHTRTNAAIIERFLDVAITFDADEESHLVRLHRRE